MRTLVDGRPPVRPAPRLDELRARRGELIAIFERNGARDVRVFGSVARGDSDDRSDVDFVVSFEPDRSLFDLAGLVGDLDDDLGCPVNVVSENGLRLGSPFATRVRAQAVPL